MAHDVEQRVALRRDRPAIASRVGGPAKPSPTASTSAGIFAERARHARDRGLRVERLEAVLVEAGGVGDQDEGPQVAPAERREAQVGDAGQVQREGHLLVEREECPATVEGRAQALPAQRLELRLLDRQQDPQLVRVARRAAGDAERVAHGVPEQRPPSRVPYAWGRGLERQQRRRVDGRVPSARTGSAPSPALCSRPPASHAQPALEGDLEGVHGPSAIGLVAAVASVPPAVSWPGTAATVGRSPGAPSPTIKRTAGSPTMT